MKDQTLRIEHGKYDDLCTLVDKLARERGGLGTILIVIEPTPLKTMDLRAEVSVQTDDDVHKLLPRLLAALTLAVNAEAERRALS